MSKNKILVSIAALVLIAAVVVWYFASPAYAMSQLKSAAHSGEAGELEERIDFPKVRESVKSQLRSLMAKEMTKPEIRDNPFGALGAMMAMGMVDGLVEGFVTPEGMSALIEEGKMQRSDDTAARKDESQPLDWRIERDGLDKFTAIPSAPQDKPTASLIFERDGLGWKLSGLKLPPEGLPKS